MTDMFKDTYLLQKSLDASWARNKVIANNIANVDTPGYKRQKIEFEQYLSQAIDNKTKGAITNNKHIPIGAGKFSCDAIKITQDNSTSMRLDGNNVDIENEMAQMAKNDIVYNALIQKISNEFTKLRMAIKGGA